MKRREKEVFQTTLDDERELLAQIEQNYINALADIKKKIKKLQERGDTQSIAYQIQFQKQLEEQIEGYLDILESENVETIQDYLNKCYETGFIGNMYQLQSYDVNIVAPINQKSVIIATTMTADGVKLSKKIAGNTELLKKQVVQEIQRGFSTAASYVDIGRNISARGEADMNRSMRIARTEGNRIYNEAAFDSAKMAVAAGVDTVKQWVAILDSRTRESHQRVDGEWVELDKKFSNGLYMPGDKNAPPAEIVNCRCKSVYIPRSEVIRDAPRLRRDNDTGEIIECKNYAEYREKYLSAADHIEKTQWQKVATSADREQFENYRRIMGKKAPKTLDEFCKVKYNNGSEYATLKHNYRDAKLQRKIKSEYPLGIEEGKQGKHLKGHNNYRPGKSYLTITMDEAQALVDKFAGTGDLQRDSKGRWKHTEVIRGNNSVIGYAISIVDGKEHKTKVFKIHYSKNGTHIVPMIGDDE